MKRTGWQRTWIRIVSTLLTAAMMIMIFCLSMENAAQSDQRSGIIAETLVRIIHPDYEQMDPVLQQRTFDVTQLAVRKCAHFTEYTLLGFLIRICLECWFGSRRRRKHILSLSGFATGTAYACTDEVHQLAIDGRSGTWTDVMLDACGVLAGVAAADLLIRYANNEMKETNRGDDNGLF